VPFAYRTFWLGLKLPSCHARTSTIAAALLSGLIGVTSVPCVVLRLSKFNYAKMFV